MTYLERNPEKSFIERVADKAWRERIDDEWFNRSPCYSGDTYHKCNDGKYRNKYGNELVSKAGRFE